MLKQKHKNSKLRYPHSKNLHLEPLKTYVVKFLELFFADSISDREVYRLLCEVASIIQVNWSQELNRNVNPINYFLRLDNHFQNVKNWES